MAGEIADRSPAVFLGCPPYTVVEDHFVKDGEEAFRLRWMAIFAVIFFLLCPTVQAREAPFILLIDPGHGGIDSGTQSSDGQLLEKDLNLLIAKKLAHQLKKDGYEVHLTRETDEDVTKYAPSDRGWGRHKRDLFGRVESARQKRAALLISIHGNHGTASNRGPVVYYKKRSFQSYMLASQMQSHFNKLSKKAYLVRPGNPYYVLNKSHVPAVIIEYGFLSNPAEVSLLLTEQYQNGLVQAMRDGLGSYVALYHTGGMNRSETRRQPERLSSH
jgi:N-acetylmuramoyl-L-alanine amidase